MSDDRREILRHDDSGTKKPITEIWAWVCEETPGSEAIPATLVFDPEARIVPLIGADRDRIESWRAAAVATRIATARPVRLVRFTTREVVETLT